MTASEGETSPRRRHSGLIQGGRGGPTDELIEDGQEEVFSRQEVDRSRIEHHTDTDGVKRSP